MTLLYLIVPLIMDKGDMSGIVQRVEWVVDCEWSYYTLCACIWPETMVKTMNDWIYKSMVQMWWEVMFKKVNVEDQRTQKNSS